MRTLFWIVFALLCLSIGAYPLVYLLSNETIGLLRTKSESLLYDAWWRLGFRAHIVCGGVALGVGWAQFVPSWRTRAPGVHRLLGTLYVIAVGVSGAAAVAIAPFSSTGWVAGVGFGSLGVVWLYFTGRAYLSIRQRNVKQHERQMIYSYSACLSAVTLRLWLPLLLVVFQLDFTVAYPIVAWLAWVPNLLMARVVTSKL